MLKRQAKMISMDGFNKEGAGDAVLKTKVGTHFVSDFDFSLTTILSITTQTTAFLHIFIQGSEQYHKFKKSSDIAMHTNHFLTLAALPFLVGAATKRVTVGRGGLIFDPQEITAALGDLVNFHFATAPVSVAQSTFGEPCTPCKNGIFSGVVTKSDVCWTSGERPTSWLANEPWVEGNDLSIEPDQIGADLAVRCD